MLLLEEKLYQDRNLSLYISPETEGIVVWCGQGECLFANFVLLGGAKCNLKDSPNMPVSAA